MVIGGRTCDVLDGPVARRQHSDSIHGANLDKWTDRLSEGIMAGSLVSNDIVPVSMPIIGYGMRSIIKTVLPEKDGNRYGQVAAILKDAAIGLGVVSTMFERNTAHGKNLRASSQLLGWSAISFAAISAFDGVASREES